MVRRALWRAAASVQRFRSYYGGINEDIVLVDGWGEGKADGSQEMIEGVGKTLVKAVERRALGVGGGLGQRG
jgi:hypothetical protein